MEKKDIFRGLGFCPGSFLSVGSPVVTEIAAQYPFKWLLLDMEHGGFTESNIVANLKSITSDDLVSIVRIPAVNPILISRILDAGADGIMVPHVTSAEQVEVCKKLMYYPPEGSRGYSSSVRQYNYGARVPADISAISKPLLFAQIEDVEGVLHVNEIAAVPGVDVLFVGPADLKLSLKYNTGENLSYNAAIQRVADASIANKKKAGILLRDKNQLESMQKTGYNCIAVDSDIAILRSGYRQIIECLERGSQQ